MQLRQITRAFRTSPRGTTATGLNPEIELIALRALGLTSSQYALHGINYPTFGANVAIDVGLANTFIISAPNGNIFTIDDPTNPPITIPPISVTQIIHITIANASGGPLGAVTMGPAYRPQAGALPAPADTFQQTFTFRRDLVTGFWHEISRTAADVPT
ncbi:MAG: hypothetical protein GY906_22805 [bacterium]|nr:hypothetical protein [bacterium]